MAKIHTLTYNGTKSSDLGVFVTGSGSFDAAELDVDKYEIPGRNGDLILSNNRYKNIEITYPAFIPKAFMDKAQNVRNWLRSSRVYARLEDTYDTDHFRMGLASGVQSFEPANRNDGANFEMTFDCKPQRFLKAGETPETVEVEEKSASGEIASFETDYVVPLTSAEVSLSPIQSGSGTPSPTNIRPISGHTGATLYRTGKNLSPTEKVTDATWAYNLRYFPDNGKALFDRLNDLPAGAYTLSWKMIITSVSSTFTSETAVAFTNGIAIHNTAGNISNTRENITRSQALEPYYSVGRMSFNITEAMVGNFTNFYLYGLGRDTAVEGAPNGMLGTADFYDFQLEPGATVTAYEPYQGDTYSVTFSDQGTVYGGTVDFVTGVLTVTKAAKTLDGSETYSWHNSGVAYTAIPGGIITNATTQYQRFVLCDKLQSASWAERTTFENCCGMLYGASYVFIKPSGVANATEAKAWVAANNLQIVYELATPLEYTLSPQQIETLLGENNVWSDAGPITLTYAEPYTIENPTQYEARPLFIITNPNQGDVLSVSGKTITFVDSYTGTVTIDCETMDCYAGFDNMNYLIEATDFPVLGEGTSIVTWSGSGECTMTPRWWEL